MNEVEHQIQKAIAQYLDLKGLCWWAVPNGGRRNISVARKMKAEGQKSGVPDITLIHKGQYYGIEVKKPKTTTPKGRLSQNQLSRIAQISQSGGVVGVAYSVSDVQDLLQIWGIS
jgi:penicillin-binding protein-related factor A (putative recombinase)